ncbi:hypothetical protein ABZ897_34085 [Nonomuraea sp. NPDC046802]|uniref:hypothetical protein n=1 Tax=Nonomuraea sp. NPDC046802 TaxID=3154919 RepID=UPI00340B265B
MPASGKEAYTALRGRLIVTNGYCAGGCAERAEAAADQARQEQQQEQVVLALRQEVPVRVAR